MAFCDDDDPNSVAHQWENYLPWLGEIIEPFGIRRAGDQGADPLRGNGLTVRYDRHDALLIRTPESRHLPKPQR